MAEQVHLDIVLRLQDTVEMFHLGTEQHRVDMKVHLGMELHQGTLGMTAGLDTVKYPALQRLKKIYK